MEMPLFRQAYIIITCQIQKRETRGGLNFHLFSILNLLTKFRY